MQYYTVSLTEYKRLPTLQVQIGALTLGGNAQIRMQTMTTKDTMDTEGTIEETIRCIQAGAELVRITAPSKKEAENLKLIKEGLINAGYDVPLVADIHFTPNAAEIAAQHIEKVRINPGNYVDKKKFETIIYTDDAYQEELNRIEAKFIPLINICKANNTAMRIGTNHGSLSDRILSRYGDTPNGMVESAMEFLRIAQQEQFHNIVLSMKSSNPQVMVQAYRLLVKTMQEEFGMCYPLHLGVTEAGDGEDGRIKSAVGIGTLLEDGIGDTIRVSLTEDPEFEIPVCRDLIKRYNSNAQQLPVLNIPTIEQLPYNPFEYKRRNSNVVDIIGGHHVPVVIADYSNVSKIEATDLDAIGYHYDADLDKWQIGDAAADFLFSNALNLGFEIPGTLKLIAPADNWLTNTNSAAYPVWNIEAYLQTTQKHAAINFVTIDCYGADKDVNLETLKTIAQDTTVVFCLKARAKNSMPAIRRMIISMMEAQITTPVIIKNESQWDSQDEHLIHFSAESGALLIDGMGDGLWLSITTEKQQAPAHKFLNDAAFGILQATRTRISKTEYISCPSCGRTLFDLQETTARIRQATHHLKGVKIGIMGCIVNGPGEMADADFGYVGSGVGKITLYKGQEVVKRNIDSNIAVDELIQLIKDNGAWVEKN